MRKEKGRPSQSESSHAAVYYPARIMCRLIIFFASQFATIDPAPASSSSHSPLAAANHTTKSVLPVTELQKTLMDPALSLFERYRAMFALRNDGGKEAVLALASGFEDESALFR